MEEIEVPIEQVQEQIHHRAESEHSHNGPSWIGKVALSSAILAALAAVAALLAGHHSNEAMLEQIHASDGWNYYQAKGIKAAILASKIDMVTALGTPGEKGATLAAALAKDQAHLEGYKKEQEDIAERAKEQETVSRRHLMIHQIMARAVTLFQVAITIAAVAVLTRRRRFWWVSLGFGFLGIFCLIQGLLQ